MQVSIVLKARNVALALTDGRKDPVEPLIVFLRPPPHIFAS